MNHPATPWELWAARESNVSRGRSTAADVLRDSHLEAKLANRAVCDADRELEVVQGTWTEFHVLQHALACIMQLL